MEGWNEFGVVITRLQSLDSMLIDIDPTNMIDQLG